ESEHGGRTVGKVKAPSGGLAVVVDLFYDTEEFSIISTLRPSARGEREITDVNNQYLRAGKLQCDRLLRWWADAGTFDSLHAANQLITGRAASALDAERG